MSFCVGLDKAWLDQSYHVGSHYPDIVCNHTP